MNLVPIGRGALRIGHRHIELFPHGVHPHHSVGVAHQAGCESEQDQKTPEFFGNILDGRCMGTQMVKPLACQLAPHLPHHCGDHHRVGADVELTRRPIPH